MIYRNSQDPVLLKKNQHRRFWLLRDELEYIVMARLNSNPDQKSFDDLYEEFSLKPTPNLRLIKSDETDDKPEDESSAEDKTTSNSDEDNEQSESTEKEIIVSESPNFPKKKFFLAELFGRNIYGSNPLF